MIFLATLALAFGRTIEKNVKVSNPVFITKFGGTSINYDFSLMIAKGFQQSSIWNAKLQFLIFGEKANFNCSDIGKAIFQSNAYVPAYGSWGHDHEGKIELNQLGFFYLADCEQELTADATVTIKIVLQDIEQGHISIETYGLKTVYFIFLMTYLILAGVYIRELYMEKYEEASMIILFVLSVLLALATLFDSLYIWAYEVNGISHKFLLLFSKLFASFAEATLVGVLIGISFGRFDSKYFLIKEIDFVVLLIMAVTEYLISIIDIFRSDPMEKFGNFSRIDGFVLIFLRGIYLFLYLKFNTSENFTKCELQGFEKIRAYGVVQILTPLQILILLSILPNYSQDCLAFVYQNLITLSMILYLFMKFTKSNIAFLLPMKIHRT